MRSPSGIIVVLAVLLALETAQSPDFTLAPDSPAFALGFEPIDYSQMGPRKEGCGDSCYGARPQEGPER